MKREQKMFMSFLFLSFCEQNNLLNILDAAEFHIHNAVSL